MIDIDNLNRLPVTNFLPIDGSGISPLRQEFQYVLRDANPQIALAVEYETVFREPNQLDMRFYFFLNANPSGTAYPYRVAGRFITPSHPERNVKADYNSFWSDYYQITYPDAWITATVDPNTLRFDFRNTFLSYNSSGGILDNRTWDSWGFGYQPPIRGNVYTVPASGVFETITIYWDNFRQGKITTIQGYHILYWESPDGINWGERQREAEIPSTALSGSFTWAGGIRGYYYRFNVAAYNEYGMRSDVDLSTPIIKKNQIPQVPVNPRYASPSPADDGTPASTGAYTPETTAALAWTNPPDPDGKTITSELQLLKRMVDNTGWEAAGGVIPTAAQNYNIDISSFPRGLDNTPVINRNSLFYQVRAKDIFNLVSAWVRPVYPFQRNPTFVHVPVSGQHTPGIVYAGKDGEWVKSDIYAEKDGIYTPAKKALY